MSRYFNTTGACSPRLHYMVDITGRLKEIKAMVDRGEYFTINRARQYGKTTTLKALAGYLKEDYTVISLDFQKLGNEEFENADIFSRAFLRYFLRTIKNKRNPVCGLSADAISELENTSKQDALVSLGILFENLSDLCDTAEKPVVLMIDEVDSATNNQIFLDFLAQLRGYYLTREETPTFQSVTLAGVYDVKNIKRKIRPEEEHKINSPWNIAANFKVNMSFTEDDIAKMLKEYESDYHFGMNTREIAGLVFDYTSGYPFLVSRLCKLMDEDIPGSDGFPDKKSVWTKEGFLEAVKILLSEKNTLFESLIGKLMDYPELKRMIEKILFSGEKVVYNPDAQWMDIGQMFGFLNIKDDTPVIANRIFEMRLYNYFLATTEAQSAKIFKAGSQDPPQFIRDGHLDMELILKKFVEAFGLIYGDKPEEFDEEEGRRRFLLYLRPIINGSGNYYIEAQTRNARRMDVVVDYGGEQFIIELKIWRGNSYNERGEQQLADYLDYFRLQKGYMLSYNFNRTKTPGLQRVRVGDRVLVEAVV